MNIKEDFIKYAQNFVDEIKNILERSPQNGEYYLFCADIFGFRNINRLYGTAAGTKLLDDIDDFMESHPDILVHTRFYSDHFLYLMRYDKGVTDETIVADRQARIRQFLNVQQQKYPACRLNFPCGFSRIKNAEIQEAMEEANFARKEAKKTGQGKTISFDSELIRQVSRRHQMEEDVNLALRDEKFCFFLQPKVELTTGEICGAEALARRIDEDGKIVSPDAFLPVMENNGSVVELDLLICRQVCRFLADRIARKQPVVRTSVNLSRLHTQNVEAAEILHNVVSQYSIPPDLIQFELTETIFLNDFSGAKKLIDKLRFYGYSVAIDDFGSGYAGINIWQELDFDVLKLDRRFLNDNLDMNRRNEALLPNLINISQRLGIAVLCEGVETAEQCRYLLRLGCTHVQGYYFSRPVSPEDFYDLYERQEGKYPLNFPAEKKLVGEERRKKRAALENKERPRNSRLSLHVLTFVLGGILFAISAVSTFFYYRKSTQSRFEKMATENLNAYASEQRSSMLAEINGKFDTLKTLAVIIGKNSDATFIDAYLLALNDNSADSFFQYVAKADLEANISSRPQDAATLQQLKSGNTIISDIYYSETIGGDFCFAEGVPVFDESGAFAGALRTLVRADILTGVTAFPPAQGNVSACYLTDAEGNILPVTKESKKGSIFTLCETEYGRQNLRALYGISAAKARAFEVNSVRMEEENTSPIYVSLASLGYNDWHLAIFLTADSAAANSRAIVKNSFTATAVLLFMTALVCGAFLFVSKRQQKKLTAEERRYLLLEQFSDTVLFDYDIVKDTLRLTSNADKLFKIHGFIQRAFLKNLMHSYIYAGDLATVRQMLTGVSPRRETRIRLVNPQTGRYFWCLVHFLYVRHRDVPASVVGKIMDIDNLKQREDQLLEIAEKDGLTGFFNKLSVEKQVRAHLEKLAAGALYMIDVDDFKQINDTYGHAVGDKSLRFLAREIESVFGTDCVFGRVGGDELMVFTPDAADKKSAGEKAEALLQQIVCRAEKNPCFPSVSIGIAVYPKDGNTFEELFVAADKAMYEAKRTGKGRCSFPENS